MSPESLRQGILRFSPSFYFPMIEPSASIYSAVGPHIGTVAGAPTFNAPSMAARDSGGIGYSEDGTAYHTAADHADFDLGNSFTIGCLYRYTVNAVDEQIFFNKGTNAYGLGINTGKRLMLAKIGVAVMVDDVASSSISSTVHMAMATFSGANTAKLYRDGGDVSNTVDATNTFTDGASTFQIGRESAGGAGSDISHVFGIKSVLTAADAEYLWRLALKPYAREDYSRFPKHKLRRAA